MNLKIALATAAVIATATTGSASAAKVVVDLVGGRYSVTSTVLTATDTGLAGSCGVVSQNVGAVSYSYLYYSPATADATGSLTQVILAATGVNVYTLAETVPVNTKLVTYQGPTIALNGSVFNAFGQLDYAAPVGASITLNYTKANAVTETITYGPYQCTVTSHLKMAKYGS